MQKGIDSQNDAEYAADFARAQSEGGYFDLSGWASIRIEGPDAKDYLQRMSTVDMKKLQKDQVVAGAFLTGRGQVITLGNLFEENGVYHYVVSPPQGALAAEHLEKFHFSENLQIIDESGEWAHFGLWIPKVEVGARLGLPGGKPSSISMRWGWKGLALFGWKDDRRPELIWIRIERKGASELCRQWESAGIGKLGERLYEYFRIRAGMPRVGVEISESDLILEANVDEAVARNKGCYPGQEVVERIFTYGHVNRKLFPVRIDLKKGTRPKTPFTVETGEKQAAVVMSYATEPGRPEIARGLAFIPHKLWGSTETFNGPDGTEVRIVS